MAQRARRLLALLRHWAPGVVVKQHPFMGASCVLLTEIGLDADFSLSLPKEYILQSIHIRVSI